MNEKCSQCDKVLGPDDHPEIEISTNTVWCSLCVRKELLEIRKEPRK